MLVVTSGYFDPLHAGHIELFEKAKKLGDKLVVIINNDRQTRLKKSRAFMSLRDRVKIVSKLRMVDRVVVSIDNDRTVCKTLEMVNPDIFAKGGDSTKKNVPEMAVCRKMGIKIVFNIGKKIRS